MESSLEGRVAIVTGAGRGIGRASALALASRGARVLVNDLGTSLDGASQTDSAARDSSDAGTMSTAATVAGEIEHAGGEAHANSDSVAEWPSAQRIVESALDHFGRIDLLVNNAGLSATAPVWENDPALFDRVVASHLHGTFYCIRAASPHMKDQRFGRIVNLVSRAGLLGVPSQAAYGAGKGGVFALTNVAARDLGRFGITVNAVNPAATETRMVTTAIESFRNRGEEGERMAQGLTAALQPPEAVAALITAVCLDEGGRFNGEVFYLEKDRVGLFEPLEVRQDARSDSAWTIESLGAAIAGFEPHDPGVVYRDD